jgi:hypothetical protein|tara:strand:- start:21 stop:197 length:177 start_codon:yes stop_codon:yes gene_type:complete
MTDFDKMTVSIQKLQPNSVYRLRADTESTVNEEMFNKIEWTSTNNLTWAEVKAEMDKL